MSCLRTHLVSAAIDIGTTYTGWAFSAKLDFKSDPCNVITKSVYGETRGSQKALTCVLIKPDGKTVDSYGYDAEIHYNKLRANNEHNQWYYFHRFKMSLWEKPIHKYTMLEDETGKSLPALTVFSLSIRYWKSDLLSCSGLRSDDVFWVITVPAVWYTSAKQFVKLAALQAGISKDSLAIATEAVAAWSYCTRSLAERGGDVGLSRSSKEDNQFMILDVGGSRTQITIGKLDDGGTFHELSKEFKDKCGAMTFDSAFMEILEELTGKIPLRQLKEHYPEDYKDFFLDWEIKKSNTKSDTYRIRLPHHLLEFVKDANGKELQNIISTSRYKQSISLTNNLLRLDASIVNNFHQVTIDGIVTTLTRIFIDVDGKEAWKNLETILMVGGYSESPLLREAIRKEIQKKFPRLKIVAPEKPGIAVLTGAVIFGHCPMDVTVLKKPSLLKAAIDFGTTYSGWAFSTDPEFKADQTNIKLKVWTGNQLQSQKAPTSVLIQPDGQYLNTFGFEAETRYSELSETGDHKDWYYFRRFKMMLWSKPIHKDTMLEDETGKLLPALKVFALSIRYMMDSLINMCKQQVSGVDPDDIHWVLTVPAIWNDQAKHFMRLAALEADMSMERLTLAYEPEAASICCRHVKAQKELNCSISSFRAGAKYLVLDAGGGTVDITVHEVCIGDKLKELYKASGGAWGGTMVDQAFLDFIAGFIGKDVMNTFKDKYMEDYIVLMRDFEIKKRNLDLRSETRVTITLPNTMADVVKDIKGKDLQQLIKTSPNAKNILLTSNKLRIDANIFRLFFKRSIDSIVHHMSELLRKPEIFGVETILMVGGYSESPLLQETIRKEFPRMNVLIPPDAGVAVLKGAVIFAYCPMFIEERVSKYTYGTKISPIFDDTKHPPEKRRLIGDKYRCGDIFSVLVKSGQKLINGEKQEETEYTPTTADQTSVRFDIYTTTRDDVKFVTDEGCTNIGSVSVPISGQGTDRVVTARLIFGETEIKAEFKEKSTGIITSSYFDFVL